MDESKISNPSPEKPTDKDYKKKRVEEIGSTLAQIRARVKANRSCVRKEDDTKSATREILSEKSEKYIQVLELDKAKAQKLEKERPKIKEAIENLMIDRENQKFLEKKIEETRAKQSAPLPEIPVEIQKRISDLEITIHNLKETLSDKEKVLESKTESWKLLSDQLEQRNIEVVDRYEMMAKEIDDVKRSYGEQETFLRNQLEQCKSKLQDADSQLISQNNSRREYEETVAQLEELRKTHLECDNKFSELKKSQESEKKLILKLKAQVKNYRNEINSKKDLSSEVERLKNVVATLEEEKGNLLLQLVDFDDYKESAAKNQERVAELESVLKKMELDLNLSREECSRVRDDYEDLSSKISKKEETIRTLTESLEKMEQAKISSEFKAAELEEKLEMENREDRTQTDKMCKEIDNLKCHVKQQDEMVEELKKLIVQKEDEIKCMKDNKEIDRSFNYDVQDMKDLLEEWKSKYNKIEENIRLVQDEKETLTAKVLSLQTQLEVENDKYQSSIVELSKKESVINDYIKANSELIESLSKSHEKISELEKIIGSDKVVELKSDDQTHKLKKLAANLKNKVKLCKELEGKVAELNERVLQQESTIDLLTNEKSELENAIGEYKMKLENVSLDTDVVQQLKNIIVEKDSVIQQLTNQQDVKIHAVHEEALQRARKESYNELADKVSTIKQLKEENLLLESKLNENLMEIHSVDESDRKADENSSGNVMVSVDCNKEALVEQLTSSIARIETLNRELQVKIKIIRDLENAVSDLKSQLDEANNINDEFKNKLDLQQKITSELNEEINLLKSSQDLAVSDLDKRDEMLRQMKILQTELENSHKIISCKEEVIASFQQEMNSLKNEMNQNENQLVKIQEMYVEESNRNDGVITNIEVLESELNSSKNEIISLSEQLALVSNNYGLCMGKLNEKDLYIDRLEHELATVRSKVVHFEHLIDERQKAMEERAKQLGDQLNQASSIGLNFEQYRSDMEQKLMVFDESEKRFNQTINELLQRLEQSNNQNLELVRINNELKTDKETSGQKAEKLESELNDIKSAYNMTLDQIEVLNGELNQVMAQIEHRNKELVRIGEERNLLIGRLTEVEDTCTDLRSRLQIYEAQSENLKSELDSKLKELDIATNEISNLQSQIGTNRLTDNSELNNELEVLKLEYEERLRELQVEKNDLLKVIKGSVETEVDSLMKAAEDKVEKKEEEIQMFSWEGHTENTPPDDSWGWNASEAKLEEEYQNSESSKLKQVEAERDRLKMENDRLSDEIKSLKVKCNKLVAKVKELKAASEKEKSKTGFEDLNFAMQEELRCQVDETDKKNKELLSDLTSMKMEKERLMKRIETLTSANNQLIEMKERQDIEVQVWQRNCAELKSQLQTFDWADNEPKTEKIPPPTVLPQKSDSKLEDKLTFLETENEELLQIICTLKDEKQVNSNLTIELENLREENKLLKEKQESTKLYQGETEESKKIIESQRMALVDKETVLQQLAKEKNDFESKLNSLSKDFDISREHCDALRNQLEDSTNNHRQISAELNLLKNDLESKCQSIASLTENVNTLQDNISRLTEENETLKSICNEKEENLLKSKGEMSQIEFAMKQVGDLQGEQQQLSEEIERLKETIRALTVENDNLRESFNVKLAEMDLLKADMIMSEASKDAAINELQALREEFNKINVKNVTSISVAPASLFNVPSASTVFGNVSSPSVFKMAEPFVNEPELSRGIANAVSSPIEIASVPQNNVLNQNFVPESPPIFKGFFSDSSDNFSCSIQQQFNSSNDPFGVTRTLDVVDPASQNIIGSNDEKSEIVEDTSRLEELKGMKQALIDKENVIKDLKDQLEKLNSDLQSISINVSVEKNNLLAANQDLSLKLNEYKNSHDSYIKEIDRLKIEISELKTQQMNEMEQFRNKEEMRIQQANESQRSASVDLQALRDRMEEQMRQAERNFQNLLLNKDEEVAHLVCEVSAKQAACDNLTAQLTDVQSRFDSVDSELKSCRASYEAHIDSVKSDLDSLNLEIAELKKTKESENQLYTAQIDYLQQSFQEKDSVIEGLNTRCKQLSEEVTRLQQEVRLSVERSSYFEECYKSLSKTNEEQTSIITNLQDRLRTADSEIQDLNLRLASLSQECNTATAKLEQEKFSNQSLRSKETDQLGLLTSEIEALQSLITEKDLEIERLSKLLTGLQERLIKAEESKISDEVLRLRGKLDEALYTVHLRDVKCDELTLEIMQLLSERDSLQLRLSEAIRSIESLKTISVQSNSSEAPSIPESKSTNDLKNKVDELHTGYMKDPAVKEDRESRHTQQMHLFTSNDPPGAADSKKQEPTDYGIFSWFFNSSTPPQPNQEQPS